MKAKSLPGIIRSTVPWNMPAAGQVALTVLVVMIERGLLTPDVLARAEGLLSEGADKPNWVVCDRLAEIVERATT